ncbi:MAG: hypothetical protein U1C33_05900, partial [Candidatus Cloacimonadaceae bacterium]|nr:hypothetical protein [Candidatus Cloacimonadaceae bacterium]
MDIAISGNSHTNNSGYFMFMFQEEYPITDFVDHTYTLGTGVTVLSELAVGNVDHILDREILAIVKNSTNWVGIAKYRAQYGAKGGFNVSGNISYVISPGIDFINKLRSTNLLLVKPQFRVPENPVYHNRLFFGIAKKFAPGIPRATSYATYCFDFSESNTVADLIWSHVDDSRTPVNQVAPTDIAPGKLIAGDFYPDNFGIEILTTASEEVIDIETGDRIQHLTNDYCPINGGYYHRNRRPAVLTDTGLINSQDVILFRENQMAAYSTFEHPIQGIRSNFFADIKSLALGSAVNNGVRDLYALVGDTDVPGIGLYRIPIKPNYAEDRDEWTQFQGNERKTAQYLSSLPPMITEAITIWQDV